ncbi:MULTISPECIES: TonB-dependent siderophore receptor [unclassified Acinetobacter]|uniref:TonB-dependent receptor n=1 Tax=unclassified Acinetobacter TaxID=196816 RepID=UPI0015D3942B|nr:MULTISPECIES: TonB-dependent siderophore receptor [unclassified Acinetobacter]
MAFIKTRKKIVSSAIVSSLSVMAANAFAQDQVAQLETIHAQAEAETTQGLKVDQSANSKFVAPLLDTPKSVSVISKQLIEDTQVTTLSDALRTVPGITLGAGEGGNPNGDRPFIRGYNSESSMYVDGVRNATSQNREMFAVEQVEVTKGSASAMGGAGTTGGSVNMISKVAKKGDSLEGSVGAGTDNYQRITLDGNKDFGNGIAARVAVMGHHNEKAGQADGTEYKRAGIAPSITFGLDTPTRATLSYYYLKTDDTPDSGVPYNNPTGYSQYSGKPIDVKQGIYYGWEDRDFQKQENQVGTIKLEHDLTDNLTITNTAVYNSSKNDYLWTNPDDSQGNIYKNGNVWARVNSRIADTDTFTDQLALTGKFNTGALKHSFNLGAEYSDQETDRTQYIINGKNATGTLNPDDTPTNDCSPADIASGWCTSVQNPNRGPWTGSISTEGADQYNTQTKSTSVYFLDSIEFNPQWILDLGLRWDKFDTEQTMTYGARNSAVLGSATTPPTRQVGEQVKTESDTDFFTYQAGLTFKPVENGSIYASYATSANPVGVDAGDGSEGIGAAYSNLDPEESQTFEIGTKWDLLQDRLNLTAAIFRTEKQNARIQLSPTTYSNIGESKVDGIELGLNGKITDKWDISAGYTYLDSEASKNGVSCRGTTCTDQTVFNGNQMPNVPKNSATLWTTYQVLPQLQLGAGATAMDKVYGDLANTKYVPGYVRYDAMARYNVNENVGLQLNVNNLSDERYFTKAYASHYATEAEGRSAVLSLNFKY